MQFRIEIVMLKEMQGVLNKIKVCVPKSLQF